jgi:hypothetical protein
LPDFPRRKIPKLGKIYQIATKLPNGHKMYQMALFYVFKMAKEYTNLFPLEGPRNFTQVWIFGLKRNHLATLVLTSSFSSKLIFALLVNPSFFNAGNLHPISQFK